MEQLNQYEIDSILAEDLSHAISAYKYRVGCSQKEARLLVYAVYSELSGKQFPRYIGYHTDEEVAFKPGMKITLKKGTIIRVTTPGKVGMHTVGRATTIRVDHILNGSEQHVGHHGLVEATEPTVRWAGAGGYWSEVTLSELDRNGIQAE